MARSALVGVYRVTGLTAANTYRQAASLLVVQYSLMLAPVVFVCGTTDPNLYSHMLWDLADALVGVG